MRLCKCSNMCMGRIIIKKKSTVFRENLMSTAVIHLNLSLEKFRLKPINANIVVHKVRLIGFAPPPTSRPPFFPFFTFISCVQYPSCLYIWLCYSYSSRDCISLALFISPFPSRSIIYHSIRFGC